jgi:NAD(P)H dehydrogenase (quinone)
VPAAQIVAAVRDVSKVADLAAQGVQVRQADYTDPARSTAHCRRQQSAADLRTIWARVAQHRNVIDAAARAKVGLLAYTSVLHADTSALGLAAEHRETEAAMLASGLPYTLLRNGWYVENYRQPGWRGCAWCAGWRSGGWPHRRRPGRLCRSSGHRAGQRRGAAI